MVRPAKRGRRRLRLCAYANGGEGSRNERGWMTFAAGREGRATLWVKGQGRSLARLEKGRGSPRKRRGRRLNRGGAAAGGGMGPPESRGPGQGLLSQPTGRQPRA